MNSNELIVVKRSGQRVEFNDFKIALAIKKAFDSTHNNYETKDANNVYYDVIKIIKENYKNRKTINVEDIQDIIETSLKNNKYIDICDSFSLYRKKRNESRQVFKTRSQHKFVKAIEKISTINQNKEKPNNLLCNFGKSISEEYTKSYVLDNKYIRAHDEGKIFIHNLAYFNLGYLSNTNLILENTLKEDNCFYDMLSLLVEAKKEINGEIQVSDIDIILGNYLINKYKLEFNDTLYKYLNVSGFIGVINYKKIRDKIEKLKTINEDFDDFEDLFVNNQLKLILNSSYKDTINKLSIYISNNINKLLRILNNNYQYDDKYSLTIGFDKNEGSKLIRNILLEEIHKLPKLENVCIIYKVNENSNIKDISKLILEEKNIKLNIINKDNNSEFFSSGYKILKDNNNEDTKGRSIIANTSINICRLGLIFNKIDKNFYSKLDCLIEFTKNQLLSVFELMGDKNKDNYKILFNGNIFDDEKLDFGQKIRKVIKSGTININLIGLKECIYNIDKNNYEDNLIKILKYLNKKVNEILIETKLNFTLSCINDKIVSQKFIEIDKTVYGLIDEITNKKEYENINLITKIDNIKNQLINIAKYNNLLTGGNIKEVILPKNINNKKLNELIMILINSIQGLVSFKVEDKT